MKTKSLHYCYPTSPGAKGWPQGCWTIGAGGKDLKQFATGREAVAYANTLDFPWQDANLACQCTDPETGKIGDWLFVGPNHREPGTRISDVFSDFIGLVDWARGNRWDAIRGTICQRWSPLP